MINPWDSVVLKNIQDKLSLIDLFKAVNKNWVRIYKLSSEYIILNKYRNFGERKALLMLCMEGKEYIHRNLVDFLIHRKFDDWCGAMNYSSVGGHYNKVQWFLKKMFEEPRYQIRKVAIKNCYERVILPHPNHLTIWDVAILHASLGGHPELVNFFLKKSPISDIWSLALQNAAKGRCKPLISSFSRKVNNIPLLVYSLARGGYSTLGRSIVMDSHIIDWDLFMKRAAEGGCRDLVKLSIENGSTHWEMGLLGSSRGGHEYLVDFFVSKGAKDWEKAMKYAAKGGHIKLIKFFYEKGGSNWRDCLYYSYLYGFQDIFLLCIEHITFDEELCRNARIYAYKTKDKYLIKQLYRLRACY